MKHTIEGIGKIEILSGVLFINEQPLYSILENCDLANLKLCGSIRIEISGKNPGVTVKGGERA